MTNKQEIIQHLRAIADLLEADDGPMTPTQKTIDFPKEEGKKTAERKSKHEGAANWNLAKHYKLKANKLRLLAKVVGIKPKIILDGDGKKREYYRYEDIPRLDAEIRELTGFDGKMYRIPEKYIDNLNK